MDIDANTSMLVRITEGGWVQVAILSGFNTNTDVYCVPYTQKHEKFYPELIKQRRVIIREPIETCRARASHNIKELPSKLIRIRSHSFLPFLTHSLFLSLLISAQPCSTITEIMRTYAPNFPL